MTGPIVLVHGRGHGGWCWQRVTPLLRAAGHEVLTPTLTGSGERRHLISPTVGLSVHVTDVRNVIEFEDLHDVVLVAHSYAGMLATVLADRIPERLARVVYLDAAVPRDGQTALDVVGPAYAERLRALVAEEGDGWRIPATPEMLRRFGVHDPDDLAWASARISDQPFQCYREPVRLAGREASVARDFVWFTRSTLLPPDMIRALREDPAWGYAELDVEHDGIITDAPAVADLLLGLVRGAG